MEIRESARIPNSHRRGVERVKLGEFRRSASGESAQDCKPTNNYPLCDFMNFHSRSESMKLESRTPLIFSSLKEEKG